MLKKRERKREKKREKEIEHDKNEKIKKGTKINLIIFLFFVFFH
jgi:hypothetical protein